MPDAQAVSRLIELREAAGLTQEQAGELIGVDRKAISSWERGSVTPRKSHRQRFLKYLLEDLDLRNNLDTFKEIWEQIAVFQWKWDLLNPSEQWLLSLPRQPSQAVFDPPTIPPYIKVSPLIGRDDLITQLKQTIVSNRTVALVGIPGVGKTAVAVAVVEDSDIHNQFADGVLWANLGQNPDILGTLAKWGDVLGREVTTYPTVHRRSEEIKRAIGKRRMLLIIDDAWDLNAAELLQCGGRNCCHLVITRVQSLAESVATPNHVIRVEELDHKNGYQLLNQLAPVACAADQASATTLVREVGGLPLAIKVLGGYLAAPKHRFFSNVIKSKFIDLLDARRRLQLALKRLGTESSGPVTLQRVIELSLDNLPTEVIRAYFNLGAFAAKPAWFDRHAAETIAICDTDALSLLIDRNLLEIGTEEQLTLHQILADFARTRTKQTIFQRHYEYYLTLVKSNPEDWQLIETVYQQLRWTWKCNVLPSPNDERTFEFLHAIHLHHRRRGLWDDSLEWTEVALKVARDQSRLDDAADILAMRAQAYIALGDRVQALELHKQALDLRRQLEDVKGEAVQLQNIATAFHSMSYLSEALEYYQQALETLKELKAVADQATVLSNLGQLHIELDETEEALDYLHQALEIRQQINDHGGEAASLIAMAAAYINLTEPTKSIEYLHQALTIAQRIGDRGIEAKSYHNLSTAYSKTDDLLQAIDCATKALAIYQDIKARPDEARILFSLGSFYRTLGERDTTLEFQYKDKALDYFYDALRIQTEVIDRFGQLTTLGFIGILHEDVGNLDIALNYYEEGLELATQLHNRLDEGALLQKIGDVMFKTGDYQQAEDYYLRALELAEKHGVLNHERGLRLMLIHVYQQLGDTQNAYEFMQRVVEIDHLLHHPDLEKDLHQLAILRDLIT